MWGSKLVLFDRYFTLYYQPPLNIHNSSNYFNRGQIARFTQTIRSSVQTRNLLLFYCFHWDWKYLQFVIRRNSFAIPLHFLSNHQLRLVARWQFTLRLGRSEWCHDNSCSNWVTTASTQEGREQGILRTVWSDHCKHHRLLHSRSEIRSKTQMLLILCHQHAAQGTEC